MYLSEIVLQFCMDVTTILKQKKLKLTPARKAILEVLLHAKKPIAYDDVKEELAMDKATFYRNITKFEEEHIVTSFESNDKKRYFESMKPRHAHFVCTTCNKIECVQESPITNLEGRTIENIVINGKCQDCNVSLKS